MNFSKEIYPPVIEQSNWKPWPIFTSMIYSEIMDLLPWFFHMDFLKDGDFPGRTWVIKCPHFSHHPTMIGIWSIMATIFGDVQYSQVMGHLPTPAERAPEIPPNSGAPPFVASPGHCKAPKPPCSWTSWRSATRRPEAWINGWDAW